MSQTHILVKYDGPALADHKMDVEQIAPAMLALADLVKRANHAANGDRASVRVLVDADVEQHCFQFGIEIVQTVLEQARGFFADEDVSTAIQIAEVLGISAVGTVGGLFGILRFLRGRRPDSMRMTVREGRDVVQINAGGDVYFADPKAVELLRDKKSIQDAKTVTAPLAHEGYDDLEFLQDDRSEKISKDDARAIQDTPEPDPEVGQTIPPSKIRAWVKIRHAVYEGNAKWAVQYDRSRDVTMNDLEWLAKFQENVEEAPPGSWLDVDIEVSEIPLDKDNRPIRDPDYSISKVHDVRKPEPGRDLFDAIDEEADTAEEGPEGGQA